MKMSEKLFNDYSYLAKKYSSKIFSYEQISFEYEDLLQEFKIHIFLSIKMYGRRWSEYRKGAPKPVPLKFYLEASCANKAKDFMKYISRENNKVRIDEVQYDYGIEDDNACNPMENKFMVNGIDLLENLDKAERSAFSLYLRGYNRKMISKVYTGSSSKVRNGNSKGVKLTASQVIEKQKKYLIDNHGSDLLQSTMVYSSYNLNED